MSADARTKPWASGPGEILRHGLDLLKKDSDTNRRLAMLSIDNAVELMIKTFLGLPKRVSGLNISRKEYQEAFESFPALLDLLEKHASEKLGGVDLAAVEWYHRLRNELYHQGNGLTVERQKVEIYAELANILFKNLFGFDLIANSSRPAELVGELLDAWAQLESALRHRGLMPANTQFRLRSQEELESRRVDALALARSADAVWSTPLAPEEAEELERLNTLRNKMLHDQPGWQEQLTPETVERIRQYTTRLSR